MNHLIFQQGISLAFPILIIYIIHKLFRKSFKSIDKEIINILMLIYTTALSYFIWFQPVAVLDQQPYNFTLFSTIVFYYNHIKMDYLSLNNIIINLLGNLFITTPIGIWFSYKGFSKKLALPLALVIPVLFELGQFILHQLNYATRIVDIDDWLLNSLGILLAYWLAQSIKTKHN